MKFWNWKKVTNEQEVEERILELNGTIAEESWFGDEVTPQIFKSELMNGDGPVTVWINSPGGDCIAASQIYTMLKEYKNTVTVKIDGIAASAASVIAMAGDKILMSPTSLMMIHNPSMIASGDHRDMAKAIEVLEEVKESIINAYQLRTGQSRAVLSHMMDEESWMNAKKAIELKFADGMLEDKVLTDEMSGYLFSSRSVENALLNKIKEAEPTSIKEGRSINKLNDELDVLKRII